MLRINPTQMSHLSCEVKDYPTSSHPKIRPFILYVFTLSEPRNNLYLLGKLTERQGRKFTDLRETMAGGLRHGCSTVCMNYLPPVVFENIERRAICLASFLVLILFKRPCTCVLGLYSLDWP